MEQNIRDIPNIPEAVCTPPVISAGNRYTDI